MKQEKPPFYAIIIACITLSFSVTTMGFYLSHAFLFGSFNQHFLPSERIGVPEELQQKGIKPFYTGTTELGWDGQYYYYMANDVFGLKASVQKHIDGDAYRYQRIGLPLLAKTLSLICFQNWVSPFVYYVTSLLLIIIASIVGCVYFKERKISPYWILVWSLGVGTQLTLLNGLPDAAADSLLIMALVFLMRKRYVLYAIMASLAVLSREVYVLIPFFVLLAHFLIEPTISDIKICLIQKWHDLEFRCLLVPLIVFSIWRCYIYWHFGSPGAQVIDALGWPFQSIFEHLSLGLMYTLPGGNPYFPKGLVAFLVIGVICLCRLVILLRNIFFSAAFYTAEKKKIIGISIGFIVLVSMYFCFGSLVMSSYTGYMKAENILFFLFFFITALNQKKSIVYGVLVLFVLYAVLLFDHCFFINHVQIFSYPIPEISKHEIVFAAEQPACLKQFDAKISPLSMEQPLSETWFNRIFAPKYLIVNTLVKNTGENPFSPYQGVGGIALSYHWIKADASNQMVGDGLRTILPHTVLPGESIVLPVILTFPQASGKYILKLSLVQEGCNWFYSVNPESAIDIPYEIR